MAESAGLGSDKGKARFSPPRGEDCRAIMAKFLATGSAARAIFGSSRRSGRTRAAEPLADKRQRPRAAMRRCCRRATRMADVGFGFQTQKRRAL
ncbi:hypothetical protein RPC_1339 [Rhodopseudomonas palustris BisB18]|uniref:Uncharacterized protein n=1 Tax=Rhodopseudomonas palustris (strain BisB18) TaxID=316056 RepID=Q219N5_RHOPB